MPILREDSIDNQGNNTLSLRRSSRNINQISNQSSQAKLNSILNMPILSQSTSSTNLKHQSSLKQPEVSKKEIQELQDNPLSRRRFLVKASYSQSVQVSWTHIKGSSEGLRYVLEYGVGIKVNNVEQFRQIYKGKAFKCIVTDLMPKTNYRFRVVPFIVKDSKEEQGEWSEVESISTTENQQIDQSTLLNIAVLTPIQKPPNTNSASQVQALNQSMAQLQHIGQITGEKWIQFERPGMIHSLNSLSFGKHYWSVALLYTQNLNLNNEEFSGLLKLGVLSKNATTQKIQGPVINYSTSKGIVKVKFQLDYELKQLKVYTQSNPKGEVYSEITELGAGLYPAAQNMTMRSKNATLRVQFMFDLLPFEINKETGCIQDL